MIEATWKTCGRWEGNIKMDLKHQMEGHQLDLSGSAQGQAVGCCEHGKKPSGSTQHRVFLDKQRTISISREALLHGDG